MKVRQALVLAMTDGEPETEPCPECGAELDSGSINEALENSDSFECPGCGSQLTTCDDCEAVIPDDNASCTSCGALPPPADIAEDAPEIPNLSDPEVDSEDPDGGDGEPEEEE